ncbi:MAG TPA: EthD family reductase [Propionibacteriaceae bacterium]
MTAKLVVLYGVPADPAAFDTYYAEHHLPLVKGVPGLAGASSSVGPVGSPEGPAPYHQVSTYTWASMDDLQGGLGSAAGDAAAADLANFASGGATLLIFEEQDL